MVLGSTRPAKKVELIGPAQRAVLGLEARPTCQIDTTCLVGPTPIRPSQPSPARPIASESKNSASDSRRNKFYMRILEGQICFECACLYAGRVEKKRETQSGQTPNRLS